MRAWILSLSLLMPAVASADWVVTSATGTPKDVRVWRPDLFTVATGNGLSVFTNGSLSGGVSGAFVGSQRDAMGCISGIREDSAVMSVGACSSNEGRHLYPTDKVYDLAAVRFTADGATGYAVGLPSPFDSDFRSSRMTPAEPTALWGTLDTVLPLKALEPLSVVAHGGSTHALFAVLPNASFMWAKDTTLTPIPAPSTPPTQARSVVLFAAEDPSNPTALFGNATGLYRGTLGASPYPFVKLDLPVASISADGVDVNTGTGTPRGEGFGMVAGLNGGSNAVLSAVPATAPSEVATAWRVNPTFAALPAGVLTQPVRQVSCVGAETCVILLDKPDPDNVVLYTNAHAPDFSPALPASVRVSEGQSVDVPLAAPDADGDAVRVTVTPGTLPAPLTFERRALDGGMDGVLLHLEAASGFCTSTSADFTVVAADGLASHEQQRTLNVEVAHALPPGVPGVDVPDGGSYLTGEGMVRLVPRPGTGCPPSTYLWTAPADAPPLTVESSGAATFTPDAPLCQPSSAVHTYEVRAQDSAGPSSPTPVTVEVRPWGRPTAPFVNGKQLEVVSGDRVTPESLHDCPPASGRPPVETGWALAGGSTPPPGLTVVTAESVVVSNSTVFSEAVIPTSSSCAPVSLSLIARNRIFLDGVPLEGAASTVQVTVRPRLTPVAQGLPVLTDVSSDERVVRGRVDSDLNCPEARQLKVVVSLVSDAGDVLDSQSVTPGPGGTWELSLPLVCSAARYTVQADLSDEATQETGGTAEALVDVPARAAALGGLEGQLVARCGQGATGTLTQTFPPGACTVVGLAWTPEGGPALARPLGTGTTVEVETQDTELDSLVGATVSLRVTAAGDGTQPVTTVHAVPIAAEPFVVVRRQTEAPSSAGAGLVGVTVDLRNTTACGVTSVRYVEHLEGAELVADSVKVDGRPVEAQPVEGGFAVDGLALRGGGGGTLTYVARPRLLDSPRFDGVATMRGQPVSTGAVPGPSTSGCGCSGGGSGSAAFGLAALALALRRRRSVSR